MGYRGSFGYCRISTRSRCRVLMAHTASLVKGTVIKKGLGEFCAHCVPRSSCVGLV